MAAQDLEVIDSTVQETHEGFGAVAEASHLSKAALNLSSRLQRTPSSSASGYLASARHHHAVLVAGHVLVKLAVAAISAVVIMTLSVVVIAAFVGGYLVAL
jgi:hypothetical protein